MDHWYTYSLQKYVIMPQGSSRNNHRQDQTILSALMFLWEKENNMSFEKSNFNASTNNKLDKVMISSEYHSYTLHDKTGNQLAMIYTTTIDDAIEIYSNRKRMNIEDFLRNYSVTLA